MMGRLTKNEDCLLRSQLPVITPGLPTTSTQNRGFLSRSQNSERVEKEAQQRVALCRS